LGGCASSAPYSGTRADTAYPDTRSSDAPRYTQYGVVDSISTVQADNNGSSPIGIGTVIGGVVGGVLGNQVGGGTGRSVATAAGVVGGAVVGHQIEKNRSNNTAAYQIRVRLDNGRYESYTQDSIGDMRNGDRVRIDNGRVSRY
jgi:outer membrane lipoprotein SlyB